MSKKTLKQFLIEYSDENDYSTEDYFLYETFVECFTKVYEKKFTSHRWYDVYEVVYKVENDKEERFFKTKDYYMTGDDDCMDLTPFTLESVEEVFPVEVKTIIYK